MNAKAIVPAGNSTIGRCAESPCALNWVPRMSQSKLLSSLAEIQQSLHDKALAFRKSNTQDAKTYDELKKAVENGFALSFWCGSADCEAKIKEETRATMRCIPVEQEGGSGTCVYCGQPATTRAIFARAY